ncbi:hypothetical protein B0J18DRAFT_169477 [Chaetomium sp. MPI-SDFR-AT-0129]|nr:hypothetical protein B0J18DRAFT_169477 [Chaetomium sp. MPI-SDFR-AT-0129]
MRTHSTTGSLFVCIIRIYTHAAGLVWLGLVFGLLFVWALGGSFRCVTVSHQSTNASPGFSGPGHAFFIFFPYVLFSFVMYRYDLNEKQNIMFKQCSCSC